MAQEPLEILKNAREQIVGEEPTGQADSTQPGIQNNQEQERIQDKVKSGRRIEALDRELKDIERERIFKELQRKIAEGIEVYLEEYPNLSMEQKQVLNAQAEAVKLQNSKLKSQNSLVEPAAKKGRRLFGFGQKAAAEKQTTHVEKPIPPSG